MFSLGAPGLKRTGDFIDRRFPQTMQIGVLKKLGVSPEMRTALLASDADVFHTHGLWMMPNVYPAVASHRVHRPLVISPRGMLGPEALRFSSVAKRAVWALGQGWAARGARCLHATSEQEYNDIRAFGLNAPIAVIPNGIDLSEPIASTAHLGPRTKPFVLSLGRIHPKKGIDRLIAAWRQLESDFPHWTLRIIGPSEKGYAEALRRQTAALGLSRVSFEDSFFGESKRRLYREAELFVLPTLNENFGIVVAEALANETPVICTKGAPWSGLNTESCGWWIDHGADALAVTLRHAMSLSPAKRAEMGARGREWMQREFSWERVARQMVEVYSWLRFGGSPPDCVQTT